MMQTSQKPSVSIVIPARNEEECLPLVLTDISAVLNSLLKGYKIEVIVVDDGSTDQTSAVVQHFPFAALIRNTGEHGKGRALKVGFDTAKNDIVIMLDADHSHIAADIPLFITKIVEGSMLVVGSRHTAGSDEYTPVRAFGNYMLTLVFRLLWGIQVSDVLNGYKAFRKEIVKNYNYSSRGFEIEIELVANALQEGGPVAEIPSHERARAGGKMKSSALREGYKFLKAIVKWGVRYRLGLLAQNKKTDA